MFGDGQVVARDGEIEIVFERQRDGVLQRNVELAVANQLIEPRRIGQSGPGTVVRHIGVERIVRLRQLAECEVRRAKSDWPERQRGERQKCSKATLKRASAATPIHYATDLRRCTERRIRRIADQPSIAQLNGAAAVRSVDFGVRDLHDGRSCLIQFAKQFHDLLGLRGMQIASRLVGQKQQAACG